MKHRRSFWVYTGTVILLAAPAFGQGKGQGKGGGGGGAVGGVTGGGNSTVSRPTNNSKGGGKGAPGKGVGSGDGVLKANENSALNTRLQPLLPSNTTVSAAAAGFANQGQFLSAVHAAHNLNIPFDQLKSEVTGSNSTSLGAAIQKLRPSLPGDAVKENVKLAQRQAERDVQQAQSGGKPDKLASGIAADSRLATRLTDLLPPGTTLADAATGFKNQGQFIAALQASKNLGIPFADLKDRMTAGQSLGDSIQALKPSMSEAEAAASAKAAEDQSSRLRAEAQASAK